MARMDERRDSAPLRVRALIKCSKRLLFALSIPVLALLLLSCKSKSNASVDDCISSFKSAINSADRSGVYENLDSGGAKYAAAKDSSFWSTDFPVAGIPYSLSGQTAHGNFVNAAIGSSYYDSAYEGAVSIVFEMSNDSEGNAVIKTITLRNVEIFD